MQFLSLLVNKEDVQVILSPKRDQHQYCFLLTISQHNQELTQRLWEWLNENAFIFYQIILIS